MKNKLLISGLIVGVVGFMLAFVLLNTNLATVLVKRSVIVDFGQQITEILVLGLLFCQIVIAEKYKKLQLVMILATLALITLHPLLDIYSRYLLRGRLDVFFPFTDMCFLCEPSEIIATLGRFSFWFYIAAIGGMLLKAYPWFKENWRKVYAFIYFSFLYAFAHLFLTNSTALRFPYIYIFILMIVVVVIKGVRKSGSLNR